MARLDVAPVPVRPAPLPPPYQRPKGENSTKDLREFIDRLADLGELRTIEGANCEWEIGALSHSVAKGPNPPALLFDSIPGYQPGYRVLSAAASTGNRVALMYDLPPAGSAMDMVQLVRRKLKTPMKPVPPVEVRGGPVAANVHTGDEVNLLSFPTPKWQPGDGGRYIGTGATVIVRDPDEGWVNMAAYRVEVHDRSTATIFMDRNRHADIIRKKYWARGQSCPAAVTCGGDPLLVTAAGLPLPWGVSEYDYAGWWRGRPVEVIKGPATGLPIPSHAEIVLEGEIVPPEVETRLEGPFSEFTGYYTPPRQEPAFKVKCILHRDAPIIFGLPPYLGPGVVCTPGGSWAMARLWNKLEGITPGIAGVWKPPEFGGRGMVISVKQHYVGHAKQVAIAALGVLGFLMKYIVVVDDDVDPSNFRQVVSAIMYRAEPEEFDVLRGWRTSMGDPRVSPQKGASGDYTSSAAIIVACKPYTWIKDFPVPIRSDPELEKKVREKWGEKAL